MSQTLSFPAELITEGSNEEKWANMANCSCGSDIFYVFFPTGHTHLHLQCGQCEQSYCMVGQCHLQPAEVNYVQFA